MSEPRWDDLIEQLQAPEPKTRRRAIRRLAQSRDPRAIPLLRNAYLQDGDDQVRDAAEAALSRFRALQERAGSRRAALNDRALSRAIALLAILFLGLVAANVATRALDRDDGDGAARAEVTEPVLTRADLEVSLSEQIALARAEVARLREYNRLYNETGTVACAPPETLPAPLDLNTATRRTYEADLTLLADRFAVTLDTLASPRARWEQMCAAGEANMLDVVKASAELDQVTLDLNLIEQDLAAAMVNPAPTFGPSPTPIPPPTQAPLPAVPDGAQPVAPPADAPEKPSPVPATATATLTPTPLPTAAPTLTPTPTATPTLPPPNLDYDAVLRELNRRLVVLGDLQRPYNNGMLDMWQRSEQGESVGTLACALDPWPAPYEWAPAERAQLEQPGTADPQLEEAVRLINGALALAQEARAIYEPSCLNQTLASTADQGIPLASQAVENLTAAQQLVDEIRRRLP